MHCIFVTFPALDDMSTDLPPTATLSPDDELPTDLPIVDTVNEEEEESAVNAGLIGGIVGAIIALGLLTLLGVLLARHFGCICAGAGAGAGAAAGTNDDIYESPVVIPISGKKGMYEGGKGIGYTDLLAFDNNAYSRSPTEMISGGMPEPPAYSEADPVDSPYSDVVLTPPVYDNMGTVTEKSPSAPVEYDNLSKVANSGEEKKGKVFDNKTYESPSPDDIIGAKNALKPTGSKTD